MILFPAIDIRDGKCVRLLQGDYNEEIIYGNNPGEMAQRWENEGGKFLHIVDLDGAKSGNNANERAIQAIREAVTCPIQVGGGVRTMETVERHIKNGVNRVIIGTAAITDRAFLHAAVEKYGDKIAVSIDARNGYVATDGWTKVSTTLALDLVKDLETIGVKTVVYTDILKDGMLQGPNFEQLQTINEATTIDIIASGGVSTESDIETLRRMNLYGAIIGKALYEGHLSLANLEGVAPFES